MRNWLLVCQDEFFVNSHLDVEENYEHALGFALHLSRFSGLGEFGLSVYGSGYLPRTPV
jgi:hypothetical protein